MIRLPFKNSYRKVGSENVMMIGDLAVFGLLLFMVVNFSPDTSLNSDNLQVDRMHACTPAILL